MFEGFDGGALDEFGAGGDKRGTEGEFEDDVKDNIGHRGLGLKVNNQGAMENRSKRSAGRTCR